MSGLNTLVFLVTFLFVTFPAVIGVIIRLQMKSTSRNLKIKILVRHLIYYGFYLLTIAQTFNSFGIFFPIELSWLIDAFLNLNGVLLALVRLNEPFIKSTLKNDLGFLCCSSKKTSRSKF